MNINEHLIENLLKFDTKSVKINSISISITCTMSIRISLVLVSVLALVMVLALIWALVSPVSRKWMYQCSGRRRALSEAKGERVRNERAMNEPINESSNELIFKLLQVDEKTNYSSDSWGQDTWDTVCSFHCNALRVPCQEMFSKNAQNAYT